MHSFSLRALPWAPNEKEEYSKRISDSADKVRAWFARWPTQDEGDEGDEDRPRYSREQIADDIDDYFEDNDYFAESAGPQSSGPEFSALSEERDLKGLAGEEPLVFLEPNEDSLHHIPADSVNSADASQKISQPLSVEVLQAQEKWLESATEGKEGVLHGTNIVQDCCANRFFKDDYKQGVLRWLAAPDPSLTHRSAVEAKLARTGSWILEGHQYSNWKHSPNSLL